jgi:NDP-sugar pyrophosphorylase family protein
MKKIAMIPAAGRGSRMLSLTENNPKAMLPYNCKPIIGHHLDYLIKEGFKKVVIVVGYKKEKLIDYVNKFYSDKINIRFAEQETLNGLAGAVKCGVDILDDYETENSSLFIVLGDIVLNKSLHFYNKNYIGYNIVEDWSRWCMVETDGKEVKSFIDKPTNKPSTNFNAMGVYNIVEIDTFEACLDEVLIGDIKINNEYQLSQALSLYLNYSSDKMYARYVKDYYDLGDLDSLNKTRKNITRHFNTITITEDNTIIKTSENIKKIQKEIDWFVHLDSKLSLYTPHLVSFDYKKGKYELEFIHSNPIQELYLFNLPEKHEWQDILSAIKKYLHKSWSDIDEKKNIDKDNYEIIIKKTEDRVSKVREYDFTKDHCIVINNIVYKNPVKYLNKILDRAYDMFCKKSEDYFSRLHGDLFFGNMLYDVNTKVLKVIDPRGEYGRFTNYGDIRYDVAKLNHSINGYYDFIINGLYFLEEKDGKFHYHFYESNQKMVQDMFKEEILFAFDEKEIKLLTGLLFLTMIPLHSENPNNQKMQFIKAVEFLNEFI